MVQIYKKIEEKTTFAQKTELDMANFVLQELPEEMSEGESGLSKDAEENYLCAFRISMGLKSLS